MKEPKVSYKSILWTYHKSKDANNSTKYPVKIRVTSSGKQKYFQVLYNRQTLCLTQDNFAKITSTMENNFRGINREIRKAIDDKVKELEKKVSKIKPFKLELLSERSLGFLSVFKDYCEQMRAKGKMGSYRAYMSAYKAFEAFREGKEIEAGDITVNTLKKFEAYLEQPHSWGLDKKGNPKRKRKVNKTSIGIYQRSLKVIYNQCILANNDLHHFYPFRKHPSEKGKYVIKKGSGHKSIALKPEQIKTFLAIPVAPDLSDPMYVAKRRWEFLFWCQGMNVADFCRLEYSNIKEDSIIEYVRRKTRDTEAEEKPIRIPLTPQIRAIIGEMGRKEKTGYVFNILKHQRMTPEAEDRAIGACTKQLNKYLKKLCKDNSLPAITSYSSRHSYASLMKQSGAPESLISEALGHSDVKTTQAYLSRFDVSVQRKANENAFMFLNKDEDEKAEPSEKAS